MTRTNPYGEALTFEQWEAAQAVKGRPLTDTWRRSGRLLTDAMLSRLVHPTPRPRTRKPTTTRSAAA